MERDESRKSALNVLLIEHRGDYSPATKIQDMDVLGVMSEGKRLIKRKRVPARVADTRLPYTSYLLRGS